MSEIAVSEARNRFAEIIDDARTSGEPVTVTRRGRPVAVVLAADDYERLIDAVDDNLDHAELAAARIEDDFIPWEQAKADLGLT